MNARHIADLHVPILAALRDRNPDLATEAYHLHFEAAGDMFRETWVDEPSASNGAAYSDPGTASAEGA